MSHIVSLDAYASVRKQNSPRVGFCVHVNCPYCNVLSAPVRLRSSTEVVYVCEGVEGEKHPKIEWSHDISEVDQRSSIMSLSNRVGGQHAG